MDGPTAQSTNTVDFSHVYDSDSNKATMTALSPSAAANAGATNKNMRRQVSNIDRPAVQQGIAGTSSNLINAIVGSGIIGLPYALRESGLVAGFILLIAVSYMTDKSLRIIIDLAIHHPDLKHHGVLTYEDLMSIPFGRVGYRFICISMFIMAVGAMISYMIIVKDTIPTVLGLGNTFAERELVMVILSAVTMLPLSMMRDISQLAITSSMSVLADLVLVVVIIIEAPIKSTVAEAGGLGKVITDHSINSHFFVGLGVLSVAMACQHSAFLISGTLQHHTPSRWATVTKISLWIAGGMSTVFAVCGYLGYLDATQGDILNNFDPDSKAANAGRTLLGITMLLTYPMESFVARHVLIQLIFDGNMDNKTIGPNGQISPERKFLGILGRRERWTLYIYIMCLIPAIIFDDIGPVLSITGSIGASCISYIGPGLVYLGFNGAAFLSWSAGQGIPPPGHSTAFSKKQSGEIELPVVGDATAELQISPDSQFQRQGRTPWWWYPTLMPVWTFLAKKGARSTSSFLTTLKADDHVHDVALVDDGIPTVGPCKRDFVISIIFIVFGLAAVVFGVMTNVYVQVNDIFYVPP